MASGLRRKQRTDYRSVLGLRSTSKTKKPVAKRLGKRVPVSEPVESDGEPELVLEVDHDGERELLGEELLNSSRDEVDDDLDEDLDVEQILALAKEEEKQCALIQEALEEEKRQREANQARTAALDKLSKARRRRESLESLLPVSPPLAQPEKLGKIPERSEPRRRKAEHPTKVMMPPEVEGPSRSLDINQGEQEFNAFAFELLETIKQLKDSQSGPFSVLMAKTLSQQTAGASVHKADSLPNLFDSIPVWESVCAKVVNADCVTDNDLVVDKVKPKKKKIDRDSSREDGLSTESDSSPDRKKGKHNSKNLKSGILTKPDKAGIQKVVQYAHEKLDPIHVKNRVFRDLSFHFLVAGELELLIQERLGQVERLARLHFLKTLCYHKEYLDVEELKDQYDATLKTIERGEHNWEDFPNLSVQMHTNLTFRVTVNARKESNVSGSQIPKEVKVKTNSNKVVYCMDYNREKYPFNDHHKDIFNKKKVMKWHVCRKCLSLDKHPKKFHTELDPTCPLFIA